MKKSVVLLSWLIALSSAFSLKAATQTFTGTVTFDKTVYTRPDTNLDETTTATPARGVTVKAFESGAELASTTTNDSGQFSFSVTFNTSADLKVYTERSGIGVYSTDNFGSEGSIYSVDIASAVSTAGPHNKTIGISEGAGAFNIFDQFYKGVQWWSGQGFTFSRTAKAYWPFSSTQFNPSTFVVYIQRLASDPDEFDDDIILHEFGHMSIEEFSKDDSLGGAHSIVGHYDLRLSWSEGAAHFVSSAIRNDPYQVDSTGSVGSNNKSVTSSFSIAAPSTQAIETDNEWAVANVLWRAYTEKSSSTMMQTLSSFNSLPSEISDDAISMDTFHDQWNSLGGDSLSAFYTDREFDYQTDSVAANTFLDPRAISISEQAQFITDLTFFGNDDKDYFSIEVNAGDKAVLETNNTGNGALTQINVYQGLSLSNLVASNAQRNGEKTDTTSLVFHQFTEAGQYLVQVIRFRDSSTNYGKAESSALAGNYSKTAGRYGSYEMGFALTTASQAPESIFEGGSEGGGSSGSGSGSGSSGTGTNATSGGGGGGGCFLR